MAATQGSKNRSTNYSKLKSSRSKPVYKSLIEEDLHKIFSCSRCSRTYKKQQTNFLASPSPLYKNNNGYIHVCRHCTDELFNHYMSVTESEFESIRRLCMKMDLYYADSIVVSAKKKATQKGWMSAYISILNLSQQKDKTYDDTIDEEKTPIISTLNDISTLNERGEITVSERTVKRWGLGFSPEEYEVLNSHYKMLTQQIENLDFVQETLIRDLCAIKVQQTRAMQSGDIDKYEKLTKLYQSTLSNAKLKVNSGQTDVDNDCYGAWLSDIENNCPAEYYKDKTLYRDFFGIGEYLERFIYRPLKNLLTGTKDKDKEFFIDEDA